MAIPPRQLEDWSHHGGTSTWSTAYERVQNALRASNSALSGIAVEVFLQGSYANDTNTRGDSDIDVVVLHRGTVVTDVSRLSLFAQQDYQAKFVRAPYQWADLKRDVLASLRSYFGAAAATEGNKAIKVDAGVGRMTADVVPAILHRQFGSEAGWSLNIANEGVHFFDRAWNPIVNFPRQHIANGQAKNSTARTAGCYKPTVRLFKNFRTWLLENGRVSQGQAPSYYIECLLWNVPDALFGGSFSDTVPAIINHLHQRQSGTLVSQNGITPLVGTGPTQWPLADASAFVVTAAHAWNNW
jgi:predicted nucleotidyltransferase